MLQEEQADFCVTDIISRVVIRKIGIDDQEYAFSKMKFTPVSTMHMHAHYS